MNISFRIIIFTSSNIFFIFLLFFPFSHLHSLVFFVFCHAAIRFSPSKRTRSSIPALKSSSQEILSSQADERNCEDRKDRLGGAYSLASLDGQGTQNNSLGQPHSDSDDLELTVNVLGCLTAFMEGPGITEIVGTLMMIIINNLHF